MFDHNPKPQQGPAPKADEKKGAAGVPDALREAGKPAPNPAQPTPLSGPSPQQ